MKASALRFLSIIVIDLLLQMKKMQFWLMTAISAIAVWFCFPAAQTDYMVLAMDGYRGAYSSAWIGMIFSMTFIWISLVGFFVIRGALYRDMATKVWMLLVATPLNRWSYLMAKWLGQIVTLTVMLLPVFVVAIIAQLVRAEVETVSILELVKPFLLLSLPCIATMSAIAIVFDLVPWLRKTLGNVLYFFMWLVMLVMTQQAIQGGEYQANTNDRISLSDPVGIVVFDRNYRSLLQEKEAFEASSHFCMVCGTSSKKDELIQWNTWDVSSAHVLGRLFWLSLSILVVSLGALFLDRSAATATDANGHAQSSLRRLNWLNILLSPLSKKPSTALIAAEIQMALRTRPLWWWLALCISVVVQLLGDVTSVALALVVVWLMLIDIYSHSALKEDELATKQLILSATNAQWRVYVARWFSMVFIGVFWCLPALIKYAASAPEWMIATLLICLSLPTLALLLGKLLKTSRLFELCLCLAVYTAFEGQWLMNIGVEPLKTILVHGIIVMSGSALAGYYWLKTSAKQ